MLALQLFVVAAALPAAMAGNASTGLYAYVNELGALIEYNANGTYVTIGSVEAGVVAGAQESAIVPETKALYLLAMNDKSGETVLVGISLADASVAFQVPTPLVQIGSYVGVGETIHYAGNGKIVITGVDKKNSKHTAWSVDTAQGHTFTTLSSGFLQHTKDEIDPAQTFDPVNNVLWLITPNNMSTVDLVGIKVSDGTEFARHSFTGRNIPHAMEYDAVTGNLLAFGFGGGNTAFAFEIDTSTFATQLLTQLQTPKFHSRSFFNGISALDSATRTLYGMTFDADSAGQLLWGYSLATKAVTVAKLAPGAGFPMNIDYYDAP